MIEARGAHPVRPVAPPFLIGCHRPRLRQPPLVTKVVTENPNLDIARSQYANRRHQSRPFATSPAGRPPFAVVYAQFRDATARVYGKDRDNYERSSPERS